MNAETILQAIAQTTAAHPDKIAVISGSRQLTFGQLDSLSSSIAANLRGHGLQPGDRVAMHLFNGWELGACYLGCLKAQLIAVPINTRFIASEIDYVMEHSRAALFIGQAELSAYQPAVPAIYTASPAFEALCAPAPALPPAEDPDAPAAILYTSGSTARPKGVIHTSRTMLGNVRQTLAVGLNANDIVPVFLPMVHASGLLMLFLGSLAAGATQVLIPRFDPPSVLRAFAESGGTFLFGLSMHCLALVRAAQQSGTRLPSLRFCMAGGDAVPVALQEEYERDFGLPLHEGFGMTESLPTFMNLPGCTRRGSLGKPLDGVEARIVDPEGVEVADGVTGELTFQGPGLTTGYWQNPDATAAAIRNGWLHTGDLAWRDADGFLWFAGRQKDIIVRGGSNIAPQEVEAVLYEHPAVAECAVVGAPDEFWGELVTAFVVPRSGAEVTAAELIAFTKTRMAEYKCPSQVEFLGQLPKGPTNKVLRRALRERLASLQLSA